MGSKLLGVMTAAALFASVGVASAKEPVRLTDGQLDRVVAGNFASVSAFADDANAMLTFSLFASPTSAFAAIGGTFTPQAGAESALLSLSASASAP
jgi:hypothetical protein